MVSKLFMSDAEHNDIICVVEKCTDQALLLSLSIPRRTYNIYRTRANADIPVPYGGRGIAVYLYVQFSAHSPCGVGYLVGSLRHT